MFWGCLLRQILDNISRALTERLSQTNRTGAVQHNFLMCEMDYLIVTKTDIRSVCAVIGYDELSKTEIDTCMLARGEIALNDQMAGIASSNYNASLLLIQSQNLLTIAQE
jgi:hypothetical protein